MSHPPVPVSVLRTCLVQAVRSAEALALRLLQRTAHALQQAGPAIQDAAQLGIRADAYRSLLRHHDELHQGYPQALLETLAQSARQPFSFSSPAIANDAGLADPGASLNHSARQTWPEGQRLQQAVAPMVELALADLDALVSAAQGMAYVHPESNPLRPENYVRAWAQLIAGTRVEPAHAHCWLAVMGQHLGPLLVSEYARTAKLLRELGVVPALYAPPAPKVQAGAQRRRGDHAGQRARWQAPEQYGDAMAQSRAYAVQREGLLTLCLLQELLSDPRWIGDSRYTVPQALTGSMLGNLAETDAVRQGAAEGLGPGWSSSYSTTALESAQHHRAPLLNAPDLSEQTLRRMMEHMAADAQLLPSVRQVVLSLEPALMQLVGRDERFFEDSLHPARQLLDELTARSLWFAGEDAPGFAPFIQAADSAARQLTAQPVVDMQLFAQVLQRLRGGWGMSGPGDGAPADADPPEQEGFRNTQALIPGTVGLEAATRSAALPDSEHIAQAIRRLPSVKGVPEDILDFVTGPWAQVIAQAQERVAAGLPLSGSDPGGYLALVPSLLWSVSPKASADTRRLAGLAPRLQSRLAEGLKSVGRTEWEIRALAARLAGLHQDALDAGMARAAASQSPPHALDMLPSMQASLDGAQESMHTPPTDEGAGHDTGLAVAEMQEVVAAALGRPVKQRLRPPDFRMASRQARPAPAGDGGEPGQEPARLGPVADAGNWPLGTWVELRNERQQLRTRLTWVSPQQSLFLFTAADGSTQSMTRRMRDKLAAKGQLHRIEGEDGGS